MMNMVWMTQYNVLLGYFKIFDDKISLSIN